jgi:BioD-like phosphotransacetylase family protein
MPDPGNGRGRNVYLTAIEPRSGKTMVALGLMDALSRQLGRVGYFRPVIGSSSGPVALSRTGTGHRPAFGAGQGSR